MRPLAWLFVVTTTANVALLVSAAVEARTVNNLPCRAAWLSPLCDKALTDQERYQTTLEMCRREGRIR